ncbi:hypothetical protein LTR16_004753 [Cryomyces antarcticus]|uniref:Cupin type-1 domain-containing protein n=1 Tax=Cryomyces antarcticus TaxID=329879 RepID=A0ABR0LX63_9PEZI|nr:hypothetical protein LTR16_004753 [Cryomyces antarcticus]
MPFFIVKIFVAALAAGAAQALPQMSMSTVTTSAVARSTSSLVASSVMAATSTAPPAADAADKAAALKQLASDLIKEPSSVDRFTKLLTTGGDGKTLLSGQELKDRVVFDFNNAKPADGSLGGKILLANVDNFPILTDLGISTAVATLGPCGQIQSGFILENGFAVNNKVVSQVSTNLTALQGTVFPMGSIHFQFNPTCEDAIFVATLNSDDPGVSQIAQNFFALNGEVIDAALGFPFTIAGEDVNKFRAQLPINLAVGVDQCLKTCKIQTK